MLLLFAEFLSMSGGELGQIEVNKEPFCLVKSVRNSLAQC